MRTAARTMLLAATTLLCSLETANALPVQTETVVHDTTTPVDITLDASTVLCSAADYGALFLKILIPELAALTLLDHQNTGAGAPCVASGLCEPGNEPSDLLDPHDETETVAINVKAVRLDISDAAQQRCETYLLERVNVAIRGIDFVHERTAPLGSRPFSDCVATPVAPVVPEPEHVDEDTAPTPPMPDPESAGCTASGAGAQGGAALMLFAILSLHLGCRRQRV